MEEAAGFWAINIIFGVAAATGLGILAHQKRKSVIRWVLFGLILPLIAITVTGLRFITGGWDKLRLTERKCPHCLKVVDIRATKCGKCGGDLPSVVLPKREDGGIDCPECKGRNVRRASGGYYCDDCNKIVAQPTQYGPRIEDALVPKKEKREPTVHVEITTAHESPTKEEIIEPLTLFEPTEDEVKTVKAEPVTVGTPSLKTVILMPLIYLFAAYPISFMTGLYMEFTGMPMGTPEKPTGGFLIATALLAVFFFLTITWLLMKRYSNYFLTDAWKINFYSHLAVGLKWSIPAIVLTGLIGYSYGLFDTDARLSMIDGYLKQHGVTLEIISGTLVILLSVRILVQTFLEELIFRGMIQQHIKKFVSPRKSVLITAVIFSLSHFSTIPMSFPIFGFGFVVGILTGFAFNKFSSCISSFIPHLLFNINHIIIVPLILVF